MCQYSAIDGAASDWHLMHLGNLALSGPGLLIIEATGVEARGRITQGCLGLYSDENEEALAQSRPLRESMTGTAIRAKNRRINGDNLLDRRQFVGAPGVAG